MDKIVTEIASFGVPGLILMFLIAVSGYTGAAAITTALATLGGPLGMLGGIGTLFLLTKISKALSTYGLDILAKKVVNKIIENGKSEKEIIKEINDFPFISQDLKNKLHNFLKYTKLRV
ncbi:MAG: hypothetical protein GC158_15180 [Cyanobacteria bacterium RI_101]|nr:hypothetical protein [Cyanobacteria bacterium RI_101]